MKIFKLNHISFSDEFYKDITKLFTGTTLARAFPFLFAVGLARIYSPENFGDFVFLLTIASILSIISTAKYESSIIIAETDQVSREIYAFGFKLNILINLIFLLTGILMALSFHNKFITPEAVFMVTAYSLLFGELQFVRANFTRKKRFSAIVILEISRSVATGAGQFIFFFMPGKGLFLGAILGLFIPIVYLLFRNELPKAHEIRSQKIRNNKIAIRYIDFPKYSLPSELLNFISSQLPVLIFKPMFGNTLMGIYSFAHRYISIPVQLLSQSVSGVLIEKVARLKDDKIRLSAMTLDLYKKQVMLGIVPFSILAFWGKDIFTLVFGAEWSESGLLAQYLAPWLFAVMLGSPLSSITVVFERQKFSMKFNGYLLASRFVAIGLGYFIFHSIQYTVIFYSAIGFIFFMFLSLFALNLADVKLKQAIIFFLKALLLVEIPLTLIKLLL